MVQIKKKTTPEISNDFYFNRIDMKTPKKISINISNET